MLRNHSIHIQMTILFMQLLDGFLNRAEMRTKLARALCVIFTILVSFLQDNALCLPLRLKLMFLKKNFEQSSREGASGVKKIFQKTLILVFEVIVANHPKHIF